MTKFKVYDLEDIWWMSLTNSNAKTIQIVESLCIKIIFNRTLSKKENNSFVVAINYH
jgi:hypothetical protein